MRQYQLLAVSLVFILIPVGCSPKISYKENPDDPSSPDEPVLIFSLRNSSIIVSGPSEKKSDASSQTAIQPLRVEAANVCKNVGEVDPLQWCLKNVSVSAVPSRDKKRVYSGKPSWGTTLSTTAVDTDPLMIKTINVNYQNPGVALVTGAGSGAVAGFAIGGPWGAAVGAGLGIVAPVLLEVTEEAPEFTPVDDWHRKICPVEYQVSKKKLGTLKAAHVERTKLELPVALDYVPNSISSCWRVFPNARPTINDDETSLTGWFYRFQPPSTDSVLKPRIPPVVDPKWNELKQRDEEQSWKKPFLTLTEYFNDSASKSAFPISACRAIEIHITWWEELKVAEPKAIKFATMVADSTYIQPVTIPKKGNIFLLPVCGGYSSPTISASPSTELIDAVVKQAQAVKEAQSKYEAKK